MSWWDELPADRRSLIAAVVTERQLEVLKATMDGHSTWTVARSLQIAEPTVRMHLERALSKLAPHLQPKEPV